MLTNHRKKLFLLLIILWLTLPGCTGSADLPLDTATAVLPPTASPTHTTPSTSTPTTQPELTAPTTITAEIPPTPTTTPSQPVRLWEPGSPVPADTVRVDVSTSLHEISPLIYGVSGAPADYLDALQLKLNSWGGNPSTRYNWEIGHAWNAGSDWYYMNGNYGVTSGSASDMFINDTLANEAAVRLALPTLGWVAKNDDMGTCSFPLPGGGCGNANGANCTKPGEIADPTRANVQSDVDSVAAWVRYLVEEKGFDVRFLAMDNEPELWGYTHYDVHPACTTYQEILDTYLSYASAVRRIAPEAELTGPVTCCWYFYWNSAAGQPDKNTHGNQDFLPWFLTQVRQYDQDNSIRTLDVLDIHYYPEGLYGEQVDAETAAHRLRSTRSLWDEQYVDESWINQPVNLIPRMKQLIQETYPGIKLGISEWNWGADTHMNGALAIADVLGNFGRGDLYFAAYWRYPPQDSPGFYAFKMYTNYDDAGGQFGDLSVWTESHDYDSVSSYAALDQVTGDLHLMLVNKTPSEGMDLQIDLGTFDPGSQVAVYRYDPSNPGEITNGIMQIEGPQFSIELPPYSINHLVIPGSD